MPRYLLISISTLLSGAYAATLTIEQQKSSVLMRSELHKREELREDSQSQNLNPQYLCNDDYTEGPTGTDRCTDLAHHHHILTPLMCKEAGDQMRIKMHPMSVGEQKGPLDEIVTKSFYTPYRAHNFHPKGCYQDDCDDGSGESCVYFNAVEAEPTGTDLDGNHHGIVGDLICYRKRLVMGFENSTGIENTSGVCPDDYEPIDDQDFCKKAAHCMGKTANEEESTNVDFVVDQWNRTLHDYFPENCFQHNVLNQKGTVETVSFNPKRNKIGGAHWIPGAPTGIPICQIKDPATSLEWAINKHGRKTHTGENATVAAGAAANTQAVADANAAAGR